jgi:1-aminocyclopropane-1-carboxylate deaminase/D-cysteine desulfhydrase-like pyridoxal-dependent ACC family enzyme
MVGMEPHLILRTRRANIVEEIQTKQDQGKGIDAFGYTGNILFDRIVGSSIYTVTPGEYGRVGSHELIDRLCLNLQEEDRNEEEGNVYPIPVGGSNGLGTWGYLLAVDELLDQLEGTQMVDHIVFACGSGGTATGITLGIALAFLQDKVDQRRPQLHAVGVCDSPEIFYQEIVNIITQMGLDHFSTSKDTPDINQWVRDHVRVHQGKGLGYATSTPQELEFCAHFAQETGIALDPVYSGKALSHFVSHVLKSEKDSFRNSSVLFWHTGGSLGLFDKVDALASSLNSASVVKRIDVYGRNHDTKE